MKTKKIALSLSVIAIIIFTIGIIINNPIVKDVSYVLIFMSIILWFLYLIIRKYVNVVHIQENTIPEQETQIIPHVEYYTYDKSLVGTGKLLTFESDVAWVKFISKPHHSYRCQIREIFASSCLENKGLIIQFDVSQTYINDRYIKTLRKEEKHNQISFDCDFSKEKWSEISLNKTFRIKVFEYEE